jgi:hypothetical protein
MKNESEENICLDCGIDLSGEDMPGDQAFWNTVAMVTFAAMSILAFMVIVWHFGSDYSMVLRYGWFDFVILSLGTFRLIRLLTYDKIFAFVRNFFMDAHTHGTVVTYVKPASGWRRLIAELVECIWCTGLWAALGLLTLYILTPFGWFVAMLLALSAVGAFLQNMSKMISKAGED